MMRTMLNVQGASRSFESKRALDNLTFALPAGVISGLIGPNGAGKTTAMKIFTGLLRPDSGFVSVCDLNITSERTRVLSLIGYVPDSPFLYDFLTPVEFLGLCANLHHVPPEETGRRITRLLHEFGMDDLHHDVIGTLSFGTQRKVAVCSALVHNPKLLLLDEPFNGLDPVSVHSLKELLRQVRLQGTTVLLSTHLMDVAQTVCDSVLMLHRGHLCDETQVSKALAEHASLESYFLAVTANAGGQP